MKTAIYTCITGGYDSLKQPRATSCDFDFICFVGSGEKTCERDGAWIIRELPKPEFEMRYLSRYVKTHPHEFLPEYEASVWMDGNIEVLDGSVFEAAEAALDAGHLFCGVPHPTRDCVYQEAKKCRDMRYISYLDLARIWATLFVNGVPRHAGLTETNLLFRRHADPRMVRFDEMWWDKILHFCRRDQLSFLWCVRSCGITVNDFLPDGKNTRNHPGLKYHLHK